MARLPKKQSLSTIKEADIKKTIVFFHPDLGIGGAERLIVDAATGLQGLGHKVVIYTSHCDPQHCFDEARDGTLEVRVRGNTIFPPNFLGRFHILFAILRQVHLVFSISALNDELLDLKADVFLVDQLSACIPIFRWCFPSTRILFYCHFPDQLLAKRGGNPLWSLVKAIYRYPFDWFEGWSMSASDRVVVNSNFTRSVARNLFPSLKSELGVIYPCVDTQSNQGELSKDVDQALWSNNFKVILSINRFEKKKGTALAIDAYHKLRAEERKSTRLVIAGGYDHRVAENVQYHKELETLAQSYGLVTDTRTNVATALAIPDDIEVLFLLSVPAMIKEILLRNAQLLVYTPTNEHFGIVPVEAMQYGVPVLAANTGGPLETIVEGETGWLRDPDKPADWTEVMRKALYNLSESKHKAMSRAGRERVKQNFTKSIMADRFQAEIQSMTTEPRSKFIDARVVGIIAGVIGAALAALLGVLIGAVVKIILGQAIDESVSAFTKAQRTGTGEDTGGTFGMADVWW